MSKQSNYIPFGEGWLKEIAKSTKSEILAKIKNPKELKRNTKQDVLNLFRAEKIVAAFNEKCGVGDTVQWRAVLGHPYQQKTITGEALVFNSKPFVYLNRVLSEIEPFINVELDFTELEKQKQDVRLIGIFLKIQKGERVPCWVHNENKAYLAECRLKSPCCFVIMNLDVKYTEDICSFEDFIHWVKKMEIDFLDSPKFVPNEKTFIDYLLGSGWKEGVNSTPLPLLKFNKDGFCLYLTPDSKKFSVDKKVGEFRVEPLLTVANTPENEYEAITLFKILGI